MQSNTVQRLAAAGVACAIALGAGEVWNSKDYTQWSDDDINQILTNSPWAKKTNVTPEGQPMGQRHSRGGDLGGVSGGRMGGQTYPGGGGGGGEYGGNGGGVYGRPSDLTAVVRW